MNGIQLLLITSVVLITVYFFTRMHNSLLDLILLLMLVGTALVFILFPDLTSSLAHRLGVGRGADLVFYLSIVIFWFVILKLYARIRRLEGTVTELIRKDALKEDQ